MARNSVAKLSQSWMDLRRMLTFIGTPARRAWKILCSGLGSGDEEAEVVDSVEDMVGGYGGSGVWLLLLVAGCGYAVLIWTCE